MGVKKMAMLSPFKLDKVSIRLNKDAPIMSETPIKSPEDAVRAIGQELCDMDREVVCIINLKADGIPINCTFASIGALNSSVAHPREMLKTAILSNAATMIMLHNHPSGNLEPSGEDSIITDRMIQICDMVGIPLIDHIIVSGDNSEYFSFKEKGKLPNSDLRYKLKSDYKDIEFTTPMVAEGSEESLRTVREVCGNPAEDEGDVFIHLAWQNEDPVDPELKIIWEGNMCDIPEEYMNYMVAEVGQSVRDIQMGVTGFYVFCSNKYEVEITRTYSKTVKINAASQEEAIKKADRMLYTGKIVFSELDCEKTIIPVEKKEDTADDYVETLAGQKLSLEEFARAEEEEWEAQKSAWQESNIE